MIFYFMAFFNQEDKNHLYLGNSWIISSPYLKRLHETLAYFGYKKLDTSYSAKPLIKFSHEYW